MRTIADGERGHKKEGALRGHYLRALYSRTGYESHEMFRVRIV